MPLFSEYPKPRVAEYAGCITYSSVAQTIKKAAESHVINFHIIDDNGDRE